MTVYDPYELLPRLHPAEKLLTETKAWLYLAEHLADVMLKERGLCYAIDVMSACGMISFNGGARMRQRLTRTFWFRRWWRTLFGSAYFWPEGDIESRKDACRRLAALSAKEEN